VTKTLIIFHLFFSYIVFAQDSIKSYGQLNELALREKNGKTMIEMEKIPEFFQSNAAFLKMMQKKFKTRKILNTGKKESSQVTFVVEKDGSITGVEAFGSNEEVNNEAVKSVLKIKGTWIPGEVNGMKVRGRMKFPISIDFTQNRN
jgi:protein TonB